METSEPSPVVPKVAGNPMLKFWREMGQELVKASLGSIEEAGKQIIAVTAILEGLYFHAIAYSDLRGALSSWQTAIYLAPVVLWLISLWLALSIFFPTRRNINISSSQECKEAYETIATSKHGRFRAASTFLALGILAIVPPIVMYLN